MLVIILTFAIETPQERWVVLFTPLRYYCIAIMISALISNTSGIVGGILNTRYFVHLGLISYSLYLRQQLMVIYPVKEGVIGVLVAYSSHSAARKRAIR